MKIMRLLILDLDGTVRLGFDELGRFVNGPEDVAIFPEVVDRMRDFKARNGRIIGVTNQGGIALGHTTEQAVIEGLLRTDALTGPGTFDALQYCPHFPVTVELDETDVKRFTPCWCRKPRPGMVITALRELQGRYRDECYPPEYAVVVGDRDEDQGLARSLGVEFRWAKDWREVGLSWPHPMPEPGP